MGRIIYRKGSLFEAPPGAVLVHSCNGKGVWGAGIAAQMKARFPSAFEHCRRHCVDTPWELLRGCALLSYCAPFWVASLFVSRRYGGHRDRPDRIVEATRDALHGLLSSDIWDETPRPQEFHSPRINAGAFGVPWEQTEAVLHKMVERHDVDWTVWTP